MGSQQLLLLVLGTIVVAVAIAVGISEFRAYHVESMGDEIQSTIQIIAAEAKSHYEKPTTLGGGGGTFDGFSLPNRLSDAGGATYHLSRVMGGTSVGITGKNEYGQLTAFFGNNHGTFSILWSGTGSYKDRTRRTQPF